MTFFTGFSDWPKEAGNKLFIFDPLRFSFWVKVAKMCHLRETGPYHIRKTMTWIYSEPLFLFSLLCARLGGAGALIIIMPGGGRLRHTSHRHRHGGHGLDLTWLAWWAWAQRQTSPHAFWLIVWCPEIYTIEINCDFVTNLCSQFKVRVRINRQR